MNSITFINSLFCTTSVLLVIKPTTGQDWTDIGSAELAKYNLTFPTNFTKMIKSTTIKKTRRRKTKRPKTTTTTRTTTTRRLSTRAPVFYVPEGPRGEAYSRKFQQFFCHKYMECRNADDLEPMQACGRDFMTREVAWFDHVCTLWKSNCLGKGFLNQLTDWIHKKSVLCSLATIPITKIKDDEDVDPAIIVYLAQLTY